MAKVHPLISKLQGAEDPTERFTFYCELCSEKPAQYVRVNNNLGYYTGAMLCQKCVRRYKKHIVKFHGG